MPVHPMETTNSAGFDRIETGGQAPISDPVETRAISGLFVWLWQKVRGLTLAGDRALRGVWGESGLCP